MQGLGAAWQRCVRTLGLDSQGGSPASLIPWAVAMLCGYFLLNAATFFPHSAVLWKSSPAAMLGFAALFALSGLSLGAGLMSLNRLLLVPVVLVMVLIVTTNGVARHYLDLRILDEATAEWIMSEKGEASDLVGQFGGAVAGYALLAVLLMAPALIVARFARQRFRKSMRPLVWAPCALLLYALSGSLTHHLFGQYVPVESNLLLFDARAMLRPLPDLPPADLQPVRPTGISKVVLLVDESVPYRAYTAELEHRWSRWHGVDYGETASLANCSAASNSMLRWGFREARMLAGENPRATPTIWSYARAAGYETWLLDGQRSGSYQNYMTGKEAALIDHLVGVARGLDTDRTIAERLHALLLQPGKRFVYVNKLGAHFPYTSKYPADRFPRAKDAEQQHALAVRYSTQGFLDTMLEGVPLGSVLIIYTSDHGERFDGASPHCNTHPVWQEFSVPLLLISGDAAIASRAAAAATQLKDRADHSQIFPTLLAAMGYDLSSAEAEYGSSLLSAAPPAHYFQLRANFLGDGSGPKVNVFDHFPYRAAAAPDTAGRVSSTVEPPPPAVPGP
ncbi:MAG TPA: sulfatase-like hydrolase/transferase [Gammaproteobacteria bacterium]|nr:sulfatase-like hydrolase/transferase [Gammaproteobacteria bacterium]